MRFVNTPQSICRFGSARCDITPPVGMYHRMWGAALHERSTGIHRPLTASAMMFQPSDRESESAEQVIVALDHCLLYPKEMNELLTAVVRQAPVAREDLIVTFSHTHGAGLLVRDRIDLPGGEFIAAYLDKLAVQVSEVIQQARRSLQDVTITYGSGRCSLATQRNYWDEAGKQFVCGFNPEGPVDDTVLLARITNSEGKPVANVVNYACHPTTLAWQNTLVSPDYPGAMREVVEDATGAPCVFLQGASGDIGPRDGFVGDPEVADRNGRQLGYAALAALEGLGQPGTRYEYIGPVISGATLGEWAHVSLDAERLQQKSTWRLRRWTVDLPYKEDLPTLEQVKADRVCWQSQEEEANKNGDLPKARDCHAMAERMMRMIPKIAGLPSGKSFPMPVTLLQVGDAIWLAVEAEHYNVLQRALRERFPQMPLMVITLANGVGPCYVPSRDVYGKGIYEAWASVLAPGSLEKLIEEIAVGLGKWI